MFGNSGDKKPTGARIRHTWRAHYAVPALKVSTRISKSTILKDIRTLCLNGMRFPIVFSHLGYI